MTEKRRNGSLDKLNAAGAEGEAAVFRRIAAGDKLKDIAAEWGISRNTLYNWLSSGGFEREQQWKAAKRQSADAFIEQARDIVDSPGAAASSAHAMMAKERVGFRKWLAGIRSEEYRDTQPSLNINLGLGDVHLAALRKFGGQPNAESIPTVTAEIIEDTPAARIPAAVSGDDFGVH